jgi:hypothetical protein
MTARVFISYRSSDGADSATALARDLDARFGDEPVFLGDDDLPASSRWRDAITSELDATPVLLVLVTPHYLSAVDASGQRCIERDDDPARDQLSAGLAARAHVIPLLCDGVAALPEAASLPAPFDRLSEFQWRWLRASEWREDVRRLSEELRRHGVAAAAPPAGATQPATTPMPLIDLAASGRSGDASASAGRRMAVGTLALAVLAAGGWTFLRWRRRQVANLSGSWSARIGALGAPSSHDGKLIVLTMEQLGPNLKLASSALDIQRDPDWQNYREVLRQRNGADLRRVFYRGDGRVLGNDEDDEESGDEVPSGAASARLPANAGPQRRIVVTIQILAPGADGGPLDNGSLHGTVDPGDQRIHGWLKLNGEEAARIFDLKRGG